MSNYAIRRAQPASDWNGEIDAPKLPAVRPLAPAALTPAEFSGLDQPKKVAALANMGLDHLHTVLAMPVPEGDPRTAVRVVEAKNDAAKVAVGLQARVDSEKMKDRRVDRLAELMKAIGDSDGSAAKVIDAVR
ncbi:MAG: hypothetical protein AABZ67_00505 [Pseudomonadota bacterium]